MGYTPASCDNNCKGCQMNVDGWCTFKDRATPYYSPVSYKVEHKDPIDEFMNLFMTEPINKPEDIDKLISTLI